MKRNDAITTAKRLFKAHTTVNVFFITSNQRGFTEESMAKLHARSLTDKSVEKVTKSEATGSKQDVDDEKKNDKQALENKIADLKKQKDKKEKDAAKMKDDNAKKQKELLAIADLDKQIVDSEAALAVITG